jgi:ABC-type lipoprotein release transport system permease subunit
MIKLFKQVPLAFFIAFRMARSKRSPTLSVVTLLSIGGIALGVLSLTVVLGVTGGFQQAFQERILGLYPHLVVHRGNSEIRDYERLVDDILQVDGVVAASPVTFDDMMLAAGAHRAGAVVKGIHLPTTNEVIGLQGLLKDGASLESLQENLQVTRQGQTLRITEPFADTWSTVLVHKNGTEWWVEDRTPPGPKQSRVSFIDMRDDRANVPLRLTWEDGFDTPQEPVTLPVGSLQGARPSADLGAGTWKIEALGTTVELQGDEFVTLLIRDGQKDGDVDVIPVRSPRRQPLGEQEAMVRLVDADGSNAALSLSDKDGNSIVSVKAGTYSEFQPTPGALPGMMLGVALAKKLDAQTGDVLSLVTPLRGVDNDMVGPVGMLPSSARHRVTGIFESGFYDYDVRLAFVNLEASQRFLNRGKVVRWIEVKTQNLLDLSATKEAIRTAVDPYDYGTLVHASNLLDQHVKRTKNLPWESVPQATQGLGETLYQDMQKLTLLKFQEENVGYHPEFRLMDWEELNQNLFSALKLQKVVLAMFFLIIILVGCFVVVGGQVMVIHDKTADIAILKTMGANRVEIGMIFAIQGLLVSSIGIVIGLVGGLAICWGVHAYDYRLDSSIYLIDRLPVQVEVSELIGIAITTLICTCLAVVYSAWRASKKTPVNGLRTVD